MWNEHFYMYIQQLRFVRSWDNHCVYGKKVGDNFIYVVLYFNETLLVRNDMELKLQLSSKFSMKHLIAANRIPRMEIKRDHVSRRLLLSQKKYVETILKSFNMQDNIPVKVHILVEFNLCIEQCPKTNEGIEYMLCVLILVF